MYKPKVITLFSGVGMQELGFDKANLDYELINYCEFEPKPGKAFSLFHNVSEDLNLGDITKIDENEYYNQLIDKNIDIIISSFPCQSFSNQGKRKGFEDETKGTLFFDTMRIVNKIKPKVLIFENVKGITNHDKGNTLKVIEETVKNSGYSIDWEILNSINYDIPQNRERWFAVCFREDLYKAKFDFSSGEKTTKSVSEFLDDNVEDRKVLYSMVNILKDLNNGKERKKYRSNVGIKKIYDGVAEGDFSSSYAPHRVYSIFGNTPTFTRSNDAHFLELEGRLTPKERMRLMGVEDKHTDKLINDDYFSDRDIDLIAGNGLVVDVFESVIKDIYYYMSWYGQDGQDDEDDFWN